MIFALSLLLCVGIFSSSADWFYSTFPCTRVPLRKLRQIDAGVGEVYGVDDNDNVYHWEDYNWKQIPGKLTHVSVGPAGVWGVNRENILFKMKDGVWMRVAGLLKQVDAGNYDLVVGVNAQDNVYCLGDSDTISGSSNVCFTQVDGTLNYYSCGPEACWGVNSAYNIYYHDYVIPTSCQGTQWEQIEGSMMMLEVGTDGLVFGIDSDGSVLRREAVGPEYPTGTSWVTMSLPQTFKHLSYDNGSLWLINTDNDMYLCATTPEAEQQPLFQKFQGFLWD
ncbi:fish-egg lectin-like isoform 2-T2 [Mantella aurantiaca]